MKHCHCFLNPGVSRGMHFWAFYMENLVTHGKSSMLKTSISVDLLLCPGHCAQMLYLFSQLITAYIIRKDALNTGGNLEAMNTLENTIAE